MRFKSIVLCAAIVPLFTCEPANAARIADPSLGLTIEIPSDWSELPTTAVNNDTGSFERDNPELADAVRNHGFIPNHLFGRTPNPASPFAASVNLSRQAATRVKGQSDRQALLAFLNTRKMPTADLLAPPEIVTVSGKVTGHLRLRMNLNAGDTSIPVTMEEWVIPRGTYYLVVGASYHTDPASGDRAEVMEIVNSLHFTESPAASPEKS